MGAPTYAIAGGGVAAASAAEALRGAGFDGRIVIVCEEREMPYRRPPLSKELLRGELGADDVALRAPEFYERNGIELYRETRVSGLDLAKRRVLCSDGREVAFEKLLVATGASPRRLAVAGERLANIRYLRTLNDALRLQAELSSRPRVLVVGTGFIGCEVAASARQAGCDVTLVGRSSPMAHVFGNEVAALYAGRHLANGVTLKTGVTVSAFYGADAVKSARLSDGTELACDVAVVGIGVTP
ncbi:MAG TPA: NAD(P)/FAD-dependent oxidoreductase, partial [Candidatus Tumulicola sp.]|nr:NAD(P)/FAD-dependent oxidoreductase [Candidatus Tumulicola sp.]